MTDPVDLLALARETLESKASLDALTAARDPFKRAHPKLARAERDFDHVARTAAPLLAAEVVRLHEATCGTCKHWCQGKSEGDEMRAAYIANAPRWKASCAKVDDFREFLEIDIAGTVLLKAPRWTHQRPSVVSFTNRVEQERG